jgi:hypothetical protein
MPKSLVSTKQSPPASCTVRSYPSFPVQRSYPLIPLLADLGMSFDQDLPSLQPPGNEATPRATPSSSSQVTDAEESDLEEFVGDHCRAPRQETSMISPNPEPAHRPAGSRSAALRPRTRALDYASLDQDLEEEHETSTKKRRGRARQLRRSGQEDGRRSPPHSSSSPTRPVKDVRKVRRYC